VKSYDLQYSEMHYSWGAAIMVYHQFGYATGKDMSDSVHRDSQDKSEFFISFFSSLSTVLSYNEQLRYAYFCFVINRRGSNDQMYIFFKSLLTSLPMWTDV
jgi:hypothetical protein